MQGQSPHAHATWSGGTIGPGTGKLPLEKGREAKQWGEGGTMKGDGLGQ
jgi:hypothetical protein